MKIIKWIASNKIVIIAPLITLITAVVISYAYKWNEDRKTNPEVAKSYPTPTIKTVDKQVVENQEIARAADNSPVTAEITANTAKVILNVEGMSCSGCISTIKSSLSGYEGIQDIIVNISGGTAEVYYDSRKIKDVNRFVSSITASGYPATVNRLVTADQLREEEAAASQRAKFYIASVGGWDISRADFDTEVAYAKNRYKKAYGQNVFSDERGQKVLDSIKAQVASRLINEGIQMQEVQRVGFRLDPKVLEQEFDNFLMQKNIDLEKFKASLADSGYPFDYFMKKFENRMLLRHYLEEQVLRGVASDYDKQQQYLAWFNNARGLSRVTIYDKQLERLTLNQSAVGGCGSSCRS
ncbi:MAG: SurA N-terminal domain-containing protein [Desulfobacterales bacterium]|nr:MAG: SurA N-terminal domain-containing protein [Desulfobacterales bacterium]